MSIPTFNENGDLPQGLYSVTLNEVVDRFGRESASRKMLALRLERIYKIARNTGKLGRFIIFGSFITDKPFPNDDDVFMLMDDNFDFSKLQGESILLFDHNLAQSHFGCSVFWIRRCVAFEGEDEKIRHWQIKRDGSFRGIIDIKGE